MLAVGAGGGEGRAGRWRGRVPIASPPPSVPLGGPGGAEWRKPASVRGRARPGGGGWRPPPGAGAPVVESGGTMRAAAGVGAGLGGEGTCCPPGAAGGGLPPQGFSERGVGVSGSSASS